MNSKITKVLEWVNKIRTKYGAPTLAELPKGNRANAGSCPLARALKMEVDGKKYYAAVTAGFLLIGETPDIADVPLSATLKMKRIATNSYVREFVNDFDSGDYPELVEAM